MGDRLPEVVVLAGGLGTRLRSVLRGKPKCLAPVGGRPFLEYLLCFLRGQGVSEVILAVGYLGEQVVEYFGDGRRLGLQLRYSFEEASLGTAGALRLAGQLLQGSRVVVVNGDSIAEVPLKSMLEYHVEKGALATVALTKVRDVARYGAVKLDTAGQVVRFTEKSSGGEGWVNAGVYALERSVIDHIPHKWPVSLEHEVFGNLAGSSALYGYPFDGYFIDIGTPEAYRQAQFELPRRFPGC